jgi:Glycosyl transferase 4-like
MYVISGDWFFCSHFLERALAARAAGYEVVVMTRERAHGDKISRSRHSLVGHESQSPHQSCHRASPVRIGLTYRRERPDVLNHVAAKAIFYGSVAALFLRRKPAIVNAPVGLGYGFSSDRLAKLLRPCFHFAYWLLLNPRHSRVIFEIRMMLPISLRMKLCVRPVRLSFAVQAWTSGNFSR